jgi:hypothetical protein
MKLIHLLIIAISLLFMQDINAQSPNWVWANRAGDINNEFLEGMAVDADGNIYITGYFNSPSFSIGGTTLVNDTSDGTSDLFIAKYDSSGNVLWAHSIGGNNWDYAYDLSIDASGNSYITGLFLSSSITFGSTTLTSSGFYVAKFDASGNVLWVKSASVGTGFGIATDTVGNCFVAGTFTGSITFGSTTLTSAGSGDLFVVHYDMNGNVIWAKSGGGTNYDRANDIATDGFGNCYVTGYIASATANFDTLVLTNSGGSCPGSPCFDFILLKYNAAGDVVWGTKAGGINADNGVAITTDYNGNCLVAGYYNSDSIDLANITLQNSFPGSGEIFIAKYDSSGNVLWANSPAGNKLDNVGAIASDADGNCLITGYFTSDSITFGNYTFQLSDSGAGDIFIAAYDSTGTVSWAKTVGGNKTEIGAGIGSDTHGAFYVSGWTMSDTLVIGNTDLLNAGQADIFNLKLARGSLTSISKTDFTRDPFLIYPNPAVNMFSVSNRNSGNLFQIIISDVRGNIVFNSGVDTSSYMEISTKYFSSGIYFVRIQTSETVYTKKLIIER